MFVSIHTPYQTIFSDEASEVYAQSVDGVIGILPHHMPLISQLTHGELRVKTVNSTYSFSIGKGIVQIKDNNITILLSHATDTESLDESTILAAKSKAEEALKSKPTGEHLINAQTLHRQAITDLKLLSRFKRVKQGV